MSNVPKRAQDNKAIIEERLAASRSTEGVQETVSIEWRGNSMHLPVISMPVEILYYNPATHRIRAQRSIDSAKDQDLDNDPYGDLGQAYLQQLLKGDPTNPESVDPAFEALKEDLKVHGQSEPGLITRSGVLINGNTRRAALSELKQEHIRVGVLPPDASLDDLRSIELALQLRKDHKRDYSFMNFLLAIEERIQQGRPTHEIMTDFRIKAATLERHLWILSLIREAIDRSRIVASDGLPVSLRLVDFEEQQGKLEELYRSYSALKVKTPDEAEALREQRLLAIAFNKSKTDLRLIESDFLEKYAKPLMPEMSSTQGSTVRIPGTQLTAPGPSAMVEALKASTTAVLQARAATQPHADVSTMERAVAQQLLTTTRTALDDGLDLAGRQGRVLKRKLAAADRLSDANDALELALEAVGSAKATGNFSMSDLEDGIGVMRENLHKLAQIVSRGSSEATDGVRWLQAIARVEMGAEN
ncbi:hypothetical protein ACIGB6_00690 [Paeniglutamicibacter gangotriensis]|uniref:Uncharacterized protein n=1 Tax=Paeniglutamicibacter gangotriensis Lz1y TaxID=1276920 RepID=M7NPK5_9MICC|nr:hypothetical protein [Paeniglutamicibacter gangotriensis]EMR00454.1 hypothetical protein ADIAG_00461 [Paeniglutamicibacter gangotriensis Lz1y]